MTLLSAVLRPEPFAVRVDGDLYVYPAMPALPWLLALSSDLWQTAVFPGLVGEELHRERAKDGIQHEHITMSEVRRAAFEAIGQAGGRRWWETYNLVRIARGDSTGEMLGRLVMAGLDPERVSLAGWCAAVYSTLVHEADPKARARLDSVISTPPAIAEAFDDAADDSFAAMVASARMG